MTDHDTATAIDWPDIDPADPRDIDEAVERGIQPDSAFTRVAPGHYEAEVTLDAADAARLGIGPSVVLTATPATLALTYLRSDGARGEVAWEPAEPEKQALAYRQALTDPAGEALDLAEQAARRDAEAAAQDD